METESQVVSEVHHTMHLPQWKRDEIEEIKNLINKYKVFGIIAMRGIPAKQLQKMRKDLKNIAYIKMSRNSLIDRAFKELNLKINNYIQDQTALIYTNENPFKLYKLLEESKTPAPIKAGAIAPKNIVVESRPTSFPPGPIVSDLQSAGIPAGIESGKVVIRETKTVAKSGEVVSQKLADMLTRLEIYPMELGLDIRALFENGVVLEPNILNIDKDKYRSDFTTAVQKAWNLSVNIKYPTKYNITLFLQKAYTDARNLAINATIYAPSVMPILLEKAHSQSMSLAIRLMEKDIRTVSGIYTSSFIPILLSTAHSHCMSLASIAMEKDINSVDEDLIEKLGKVTIKEKEEEEEEEVEPETEIETKEEETEKEKEEEAASGLSSLFG